MNILYYEDFTSEEMAWPFSHSQREQNDSFLLKLFDQSVSQSINKLVYTLAICLLDVLVCKGCGNKYHKLGSLNNKNLLFHSFRDYKFKIRVLVRLVPSDNFREISLPGLFPWFENGHLLPVCLYIVFSVCLSFHVSKYPPFIRTLIILD